MRALKKERGRDHLLKQELGMDKVVCIEGGVSGRRAAELLE